MQQFGQFVVHHWDLFLALIVILGLLVGQGFMGRLRGYGEIDPLDAVRKINHEEAVLLDVREDKEYQQGHILDSVHIPLGTLASRLGELDKFKGRPIIIGCRSGSRSASACGKLRKSGFEDIYNLRGGVLAWESANLPLMTRQGKRKKR